MASESLAREIIDAIGGADNVKTIGQCITRLRFVLKDESKANDDVIKNIEGVKAVAHSAGQYQLIIGTGVVDDYLETILKHYSFDQAAYDDVETDGVSGDVSDRSIGGMLSRALGIVSGSITPWLGCIMGSLMISAILSLFTSLGVLSTTDSTYLFFSTVSGACLYSLPVFIGYTAAEQMHTNKYMGALLGAILMYPALSTAISDGTVGIFGLQVQNFSYTSTIIPILLAVWLLKYVEKLAKKICPQVIYVFGVTLIELIITVPIIYLVVGPIGVVVTNAISSFVMFIHANAGFLAPAVAGAIMPLAVMGGVHYGLFPIAAVMIADVGFDPIIHPALMAYNMSIAGSCLAYGLASRDENRKSLGISSFISAIVGITEAGLFGVVIPNKRVLATTEVGILVSGVICGVVGYKSYVPLAQSVFAIPAAADGGFNLAACVIVMVAGIVASFIATYLFGGVKEARAK